MTERPDLPADGKHVPAAGPAVPDDPWSADALVDRLLHDDVDGAVAGSPLAGLVHALRGPATADELAGESAAVAAFLAAVELGPTGSVTSPTHREERPRSRRRTPVLSTLIASKLAFGAAAAAAVTLGGTAAAAYTGTLPTGLQKVASQTIGAPAPATVVATDATTPAADPETSSTETETPGTPETPETPDSESPSTEAVATPSSTPTAEAKGPDAAGPAAFGLCTAFTHGGLHNPASAAFQALVTAANGTSTSSPSASASQSTSTATVTASTEAGTTDQSAADEEAVTSYCAGILGSATSTATSSTAAQHGKSAEHRKSEATEAPEPEATESTEAQDQQDSSQTQDGTSSATATEHGKSGSHRGGRG
jgi:hypothetical protein